MLFNVDVEKFYHAMRSLHMAPSFVIPNLIIKDLHAERATQQQIGAITDKNVKNNNNPIHSSANMRATKSNMVKGINSFFQSNVCYFCNAVSSNQDPICSNCQK